MKPKKQRRTFEIRPEDLANIAAEEALEFEVLLTRHAEQYAPDGPDEEDCVYTMAKALWLKRFLPSKRTAAKRVDEGGLLLEFHDLLVEKGDEYEVMDRLYKLPDQSRDHLLAKVKRRAFRDAQRWKDALKAEIENVLMSKVVGEAHERHLPLEKHAWGLLSDEALARELEYERQLDATFERARERLLATKAAKRQIGFSALRRFHRANGDRIGRSFDEAARKTYQAMPRVRA
jgi:hypothetical protein